MTNIVYIAGPYGAENPQHVAENVARACALGQFAAFRGNTPLVPHAIGWMGCHGSRLENDDGSTRGRALQCGENLARAAATCEGSLWVITRADGSRSQGTELEFESFLSAANMLAPDDVQSRSWQEWVETAREHAFDLPQAMATILAGMVLL